MSGDGQPSSTLLHGSFPPLPAGVQQHLETQNPVQAPPQPKVATRRFVKAAATRFKIIKVETRLGYGGLGEKCVILANHFLVDLGEKDPYQYDVTITPGVKSKSKSREILKLLSNLYKQSHLGNMLLAYDGKKSVFTAGPLPFESKEFLVKLTQSNGLVKEYKVNFKFVSRKDLHHLRQYLSGSRQHAIPQETIQVLDVVLREAALTTCSQIVGRSLFRSEFGYGVLGDGVEFWKGFYHSVRPTQMGFSLIVDTSTRAFYETRLVTEFIAEFLGKDLTTPFSDQERIKVKRALRGARVEVRPRNRVGRYDVQTVTVQPIKQLMFPVDATGATISVVQYFEEKYNIHLRFPHLPAIQAGTY